VVTRPRDGQALGTSRAAEDGGRLAYLAIERGVTLAQAGRVGALVTAALN
jgi:4-hydroxythreonine-4-phosphate dehydrogenase